MEVEWLRKCLRVDFFPVNLVTGCCHCRTFTVVGESEHRWPSCTFWLPVQSPRWAAWQHVRWRMPPLSHTGWPLMPRWNISASSDTVGVYEERLDWVLVHSRCEVWFHGSHEWAECHFCPRVSLVLHTVQLMMDNVVLSSLHTLQLCQLFATLCQT